MTTNTSKKDLEELEESKRRILEENPNISKDTRIYAIIIGRAKNT